MVNYKPVSTLRCLWFLTLALLIRLDFSSLVQCILGSAKMKSCLNCVNLLGQGHSLLSYITGLHIKRVYTNTCISCPTCRHQKLRWTGRNIFTHILSHIRRIWWNRLPFSDIHKCASVSHDSNDWAILVYVRKWQSIPSNSSYMRKYMCENVTSGPS